MDFIHAQSNDGQTYIYVKSCPRSYQLFWILDMGCNDVFIEWLQISLWNPAEPTLPNFLIKFSLKLGIALSDKQ